MNNKMTAMEKQLSNIFSREKIIYNVPSYQRPYSWTNKEAECLFNDLSEAFEYYNNDNSEYFLGSIITTLSNGSNSNFDVVDGQQRLVTLSFLFLAIKNSLKEKRKEITDEINADKINRTIYSIEERLFEDSAQNHPKIRVRIDDQLFYKDILCGNNFQNYTKISSSKRRMVDNYDLFFDKINSTYSDYESLLGFHDFLIEKVLIVLIITANTTSSFRIFDVLNSRGVPLSAIDLLKSKIFEKIYINSPSKIDDFNRLWTSFENKVGMDKLNIFYRSHCFSKIEKASSLCLSKSKKYEEKLNNDLEMSKHPIKIVEELNKSADNFLMFTELKFVNIEINQSLQIINLINKGNNRSLGGYDTWIPPLLALKNRMDEFEGEDITSEQFVEFVKMYEVFFIQSLLLRTSKPKIQQAYSSLIVAINNLEKYSVIKNILINMLKNEDIDETLRKSFSVKTPSVKHLIKGLLLRLNFNMCDEKYLHIDIDNLTIEHVLPQNITSNYWRDLYSHQDHNIWVNKLGNFVLLIKSKNSGAKNSSFKEKKCIYTKDTNSIFPLTRDVLEYNDWGMSDINKRHTQLIKMVKNFLLQYRQL